MKIIRYMHHGNNVAVFAELRGKHREHCLCHASCDLFKPGTEDNCPIAQRNFELCTRYGVVTPVYECKEFRCERQ